ncbi:uncharacterized protein Z520_02921 [Fonsecaea multimorphosa CBS 102226]|uniref:Uncharacterized protein n=1 Tax=Fonsecaea multimorphosa CBS 102226 TaxID=1442371 RepID=A0A0D2KX22_9EURO|nr:uncharacterized protein Z520_02921 [Fonsecaea multimorphosa CBS 102226]KIY01369.1 hypothetical protein Z520_02921 [Fonsecaea multimorphosa CBS 102226]OAL28645.1 hypothetical protein AYO22_02839 [Fonsecaea multimorphosa]
MEQEGLSLVRATPPHGHPSPHEHSSTWIPHQTPECSSPQEDDHFPEGDSLEHLALELYVETLLSRAHALLFNSIRDDVNGQDTLFDRGKEILEEAVSLCLSRQYSVSNALIAKCWYMRGFLADISGDDDNALRSFVQAASLDASYKSLQRVLWYLRNQDDLDELFEAWDDPEEPVESRNDEYHVGEPDSHSDAASTMSPPSVHTENSRHSELFQFLLRDINNNGLTEDKLIKGIPSPVFAPRWPHHLPPIATPHNGLVTPTDRVDQLVLEKIYGSGGERRAAQETREALKGHENSPIRDLFLRRVEETKEKAKMEAGERMRQIREARTRQASADSRRLSGQEALLSDGPSIAELDTTTAPAEDGAGSPRKLTINTRGIRRLSISSKSSDRSPAPPSPLRKTSLPGDAQAAH